MIGFVDYNLLFINGFELIYKNVFNHLKDEKLINAVGTELIEEVGKKNNSKTLVIGYKIETVKDFCNVYLKYFIENNVKIIKCKNCGQYFIPKNRTDEVYCDNISPQNAKKTCKEYGAKKTYREQIKSNKVKYEHNKTSQFYRMRINRSGNKDEKSKYEKLFNIYKETYQKQKKKYNNGNGSLSEKDFIEWITKQKNI